GFNDVHVFPHGDELWVFDGTVGERDVVRTGDGATLSHDAVATPPADVAWDSTGNRYEVTSNEVFANNFHTVLVSFDPAGGQRWGQVSFSSDRLGATTVSLGADGIAYLAAHDALEAYSQASG